MDYISVISVCSSSSVLASPPPEVREQEDEEEPEPEHQNDTDNGTYSVISVGSESLEIRRILPSANNIIEAEEEEEEEEYEEDANENNTMPVLENTEVIDEHHKVNLWINSCHEAVQEEPEEHSPILVEDSSDGEEATLEPTDLEHDMHEPVEFDPEKTSSVCIRYDYVQNTKSPVAFLQKAISRQEEISALEKFDSVEPDSSTETLHNKLLGNVQISMPESLREAANTPRIILIDPDEAASSTSDRNICIRHDYKSLSLMPASSTVVSAPVLTCMQATQTGDSMSGDDIKNEDGICQSTNISKSTQVKSFHCNDETREDQNSKLSERCTPSPPKKRCPSSVSSNRPLSPDSQKKEFCNYLQLMNPLDQKQTAMLEFRRSMRVRNLKAMMEQKSTEKDLRQENSDKKKQLTPTDEDKGKFAGEQRKTVSEIDLNETSSSPKNVVIKEPKVQSKNKLLKTSKSPPMRRTNLMSFDKKIPKKEIQAWNSYLASSSVNSSDENFDTKQISSDESTKSINNQDNDVIDIDNNCCDLDNVISTKNRVLPLPSKEYYEKVVDLESSLQDIIQEVLEKRSPIDTESNPIPNGTLEEKKKKPPPRLGKIKYKKKRFNWKPKNSLRSQTQLNDLTLEQVVASSCMTRRSRLLERTKRQQRMRENRKKHQKHETSLTIFDETSETPADGDHEIQEEIDRKEISKASPCPRLDENVSENVIVPQHEELGKKNAEFNETVPVNTDSSSQADTDVSTENATSIISRVNYDKNYKVQKIIEDVETQNTNKKSLSPDLNHSRCQILTVNWNSDDENNDWKYIVDDILELDNLTGERRRDFIFNRILSSEYLVNLISAKNSAANHQKNSTNGIVTSAPHFNHRKHVTSVLERVNYDKNDGTGENRTEQSPKNGDCLSVTNSGRNSRCEILTIHGNSDDENRDNSRNLLDSDLDSLADEDGRRKAILNRILSSESLVNFICQKRTSRDKNFQQVCKIVSDISDEFRLQQQLSHKRDSDHLSHSDRPSKNIKPNTEPNEASYEDLTNHNRLSTAATDKSLHSSDNEANDCVNSEHNYATADDDDESDSEEDDEGSTTVDHQSSSSCDQSGETDNADSCQRPATSSPCPDKGKTRAQEALLSFSKICSQDANNTGQFFPVNRKVRTRSLHRSLFVPKPKKLLMNNKMQHADSGWESDSNDNKKKLSHSIALNRNDGPVLRAFYVDHNLIVCQQHTVAFWTQSALGNILAAQDMWIPNGHVQRLLFNNKYAQKETDQMIMSTETTNSSTVYAELWTKEHRSDFRERPVTDVFAMLYFRNCEQQQQQKQSGGGGRRQQQQQQQTTTVQLGKKALQLENINGSSEDVQYVVFASAPKIIVSWYTSDGHEKRTNIHSYVLASNFQIVISTNELAPISHYVSSLHNVEDCNNLLMGCGENKITLWNIDYGYIVATIELSTIMSDLTTAWAKCDRGFLFTVHECRSSKELRLIAINGIKHTWKNLQKYQPSYGFDGLKGVYLENGILIAFYAQGIMCWNAKTGEPLIEEATTNHQSEYFSSGKHVIMISDDHVIVEHALSHFVTATEDA